MTKEKYYWLNDDSRKFLERGYLLDGEVAEQRYRNIAEGAEQILKIKGFADKFEDYLSKGYYSISSPIISNFNRDRGLPISCFGSYIDDSMEAIVDKYAEVAIMTKMGGGTSAYFGAIRGRGTEISTGGKSTGSIPFIEMFDMLMKVVSQGSIRRGSFAAYLPVEHPDIEEFLKIRSDGSDIQNVSIGVNVSDEWMNKVLTGDKAARKIWGLIIKKRFETGYPYISFIDTINDAAPEVYKDKGLRINNQNLCNEIALSNSKDESYVCNLSSMNFDQWDEWKDTDAVETLVYFLDAVMTEFINKTDGLKHMEAPRKFAISQRALGIGCLGWHSLLQSKMIAYESMEAKFLSHTIWSFIRNKADQATAELATLFGEPELLKGYGRRNVTTLAIAPTTSSSFIVGQVSPASEPQNSNYYTKDLAKGKFTYKNPYLIELLTSKSKNTKEIWKTILMNGGSVQTLDCLTDEEKAVFKTFSEISQKEVVIHASIAQKYVDQGISLNLMVAPDTKPKEVSDLMIFAWQQKIKGFYYQRSSNPSQLLSRSIMTCASCEA